MLEAIGLAVVVALLIGYEVWLKPRERRATPPRLSGADLAIPELPHATYDRRSTPASSTRARQLGRALAKSTPRGVPVIPAQHSDTPPSAKPEQNQQKR